MSTPGKLVVLAHTPPPFHGQSLMVALMLDEFRKAPGPAFYHVDCRYSDSLKTMGRAGLGKFLLALRYAFQALALRFRHGATSLYFVPAPGKHPAFLRDAVILLLLRPFFRRVIFQWHAAGLSDWLENRAWPIERWLGRRLYADHALSIVQLEEKTAEASYFRPREIRVIPYGIPDPCPDFTPAAPRPAAAPIRLLFLSIATREKGVFAAVSAWRSLNERAAAGSPRYRLDIAGEFPDPVEEAEFQAHLHTAREAVARLNLGPEAKVEILGSVHGEAKWAAYRSSDIFLFPSTYRWESFGVVLIEAAHFGLPCVTCQPLVGPAGLSPELHRKVPMHDLDAFIDAVADTRPGADAAIRADARARFDIDLFGERMRAACLEERPPMRSTVPST